MLEKEFSSLPRWYTMRRMSRRNLTSRLIVLLAVIAGCLLTYKTYFLDENYWEEPPPKPEYVVDKYIADNKVADGDVFNDHSEIPAITDEGERIESFLGLSEAQELCRQHNMNPYPYRNRHRKVYDLFLIGTELDWTEIRLNELFLSVDYFVISEADVSFTNHTKPMYFKQNWDKFVQFEDQIIYHTLNDEAIRDNGLTWSREQYSRNSLMTQIFPSLLGKRAPNFGDVIIVSDVDEIPRPETIELLRNCDFPARTGIQSRFFLYSFQWHRADWDWFHPQVTYWQGNKTILPEKLRMERTSYQFPNGAWHCTSCFGTMKEFLNKIESFSHQEFNRPEFKDPQGIIRRVQNGTDLFDRGFPYEKFPQDKLDAPDYLLQHRSRFPYLLDRDAPNANFRDYGQTDGKLEDDGFDRNETMDFGVPKLPIQLH